MGINGLLQYLKSCYVDVPIRDLSGKTAAVDTYAWLHKIIKGESGKCLIKGGKQKLKFVKDIMKRIQKINRLGVKLILVFDGGPLPRKRLQQQCRKKKRQQNRQKAKQFFNTGEQEQGYKKMAQAVDITPDIAFHLINELQKQNKPQAQFIVAPYQADAQLAYLNRQGIVDFIITQDSDLLAFGAKKVLYKLDFLTMSGKMIELDSIKNNSSVLFNWFNHCMFLTTCILCGCDYLNQLPGIGLKKAKQKIARGSTFKSFIEQMEKNSIPQDYQENFMKAFLTFRYQRVYNPIRKQCVQINEMDFNITKQKLKEQNSKKQQWSKQVLNQQVLQFVQANINNLNFDFLGPKHQKQVAIKIAQGQINPISLTPYKLDNLEYLEFNNLHEAGKRQTKNSSSQFNKNNKNGKQKYNPQTSLDSFFSNKGTMQKRDFVKTNYRPLKMSKEDQIQCFSLQSDSDNDSKLQIPSKKSNLQQKKRRLILNQSQEEDQKQSSSMYESDHCSLPIQIKSSSIDIFQFQYRGNTKEYKKKQQQLQYEKQLCMLNTFSKQSDSIQRISQVNPILQSTPKSYLQNSFQNIYEYQYSKKNNFEREKQIRLTKNDLNQRKQQEQDLKFNSNKCEEKWKQIKTNPYFQIINSIKPMFDQKFFKNPFGASL